MYDFKVDEGIFIMMGVWQNSPILAKSYDK